MVAPPLVSVPVPHALTPVPKRVSTHSNLSEIVESFKAPPIKATPQRGVQPWERNAWTKYHMSRMEVYAKKSESPNLSLYEIKTGKKDKRVERVILALYTYFVGVAFLFFLFTK